jgi:hypothetical protein
LFSFVDSEKRSFVHGGGVRALLQLLAGNESLHMKVLEQLEQATFFGMNF